MSSTRDGGGALRCAMGAGGSFAAAIATTGCLRSALPVQHVAIYRNGVAYIERGGHVPSSEVAFRMRDGEIDDFLATLAVTERGGRSVRAAAFPTERSGNEDRTRMETVVLSLDGSAHDVHVGYVTGAPVWKPSYRLVMGDRGDSDFQIWGLVQNLSGEDWRNVRLSLIAGAPIAFSSELQTPVIPSRPTIVDRGESIGAVPEAETMLTQPLRAVDNGVHVQSQSSVSRGMQPAMGYHMKDETFESTGSTRTVPASFGGSTRYDLPAAITIPDETTSMVMVLSRRVRGEEALLFAPNSGIPESASHPFRAVRFTNDTGGEIEPGPIAMFQKGAFLGQALLDVLPAGASSTLPFALERGVEVSKESTMDSAPPNERVARIADGKLTLETLRATQIVYHVRNGEDGPIKLVVKHTVSHEAVLSSPPPGTEQRTGASTALVPMSLPARESGDLLVNERRGEYASADWFSEDAGHAVRSYLADPKSDPEVVRKLSAAWPLREEASSKMQERQHLRQQSFDSKLETEELRQNLAVAGGGSGDALRAKLGARLAQAMARISDNDRKIVALDADIASLSDRFKRAIENVTLP